MGIREERRETGDSNVVGKYIEFRNVVPCIRLEIELFTGSAWVTIKGDRNQPTMSMMNTFGWILVRPPLTVRSDSSNGSIRAMRRGSKCVMDRVFVLALEFYRDDTHD